MHIFIVSPYFSTVNVFWKNSYKKRLKDLFKEIKRANLVDKVENLHILGIHGEDFTMDYNKWLGPKWFDNGLIQLKGTLGCALSHLKILHEIKRLNLQEDVLVIEDDCILHPNFLNLIPSFPPDYDFLHMFTWCKKCYEFLDEEVQPNLKKITKDTLQKGDAWGTYTYFVNGRKIDHIINTLLPLKDTIDNNTIGGFNPSLNSYLLNPELKASGDKPVSLRKYINAPNISYLFNIVDHELIKYLCDFSKIEIQIHPNMILDVDKYRVFKFLIEDSEKNIIPIDNHIKLNFEDCPKIPTAVTVTFKDLKLILKNKNKYKLHIYYVHPDGRVIDSPKPKWPEKLDFCKKEFVNYGEILHKSLTFEFVI